MSCEASKLAPSRSLIRRRADLAALLSVVTSSRSSSMSLLALLASSAYWEQSVATFTDKLTTTFATAPTPSML